MEIRKTLSEITLETRADNQSNPIIVGYSAMFNARTEIQSFFGTFTESIDARAFDEVLKERQDTKALFDHDSRYVLGRVGNNTLELTVDQRGLKATIKPNPAVSYVADLIENIRSGTIHGQSFAFTIKEDKWDFGDEETDIPHREILSIGKLYDVGPVTYPAYEATTIEAKAAGDVLNELRTYRSVFRQQTGVELRSITLGNHVGITNLDSISIRMSDLAQKIIPDVLRVTPTDVLHKKLDMLL